MISQLPSFRGEPIIARIFFIAITFGVLIYQVASWIMIFFQTV